MAWFELHQELWSHPKTKRLARLLNISRPQAVGHVVGMWIWALDYAQDGDLSTYERGDIADACDWDGNPDELVQALLDCGRKGGPGFLVDDGGLQINDWQCYAGKTVTRRQQTADRVRKYRARNTDDTPTSETGNADVTRYTGVSNATTVHDSTVHDNTRDEGIARPPASSPPVQEPADPEYGAALSKLEALGMITGNTLLEFQSLWPDMQNGRRAWVEDAITVAQANKAKSPAYAVRVLGNALKDDKRPGSQPERNTRPAGRDLDAILGITS